MTIYYILYRMAPLIIELINQILLSYLSNWKREKCYHQILWIQIRLGVALKTCRVVTVRWVLIHVWFQRSWEYLDINVSRQRIFILIWEVICTGCSANTDVGAFNCVMQGSMHRWTGWYGYLIRMNGSKCQWVNSIFNDFDLCKNKIIYFLWHIISR